jgi:hypothetical protein
MGVHSTFATIDCGQALPGLHGAAARPTPAKATPKTAKTA